MTANSSLNKFLFPSADAKLLSLFRVTFASLGILFALRIYSLRTFEWPDELYQPMKALNILWLIQIMLVLIGWEGKYIKLLHFLTSSLLLNIRSATFTVEDLFYLLGAFWLTFIRTDIYFSVQPKKEYSLVPGWPVILMGATLGSYLLTAGICKILDPLWLSGYGLYYTLMLPWIKPANLNFILNWHWPIVAINYIAIAFEILFVFLFLIPKLRAVSLLLLTVFMFQLFYPLRIDLIGPLGIALLFAFASVIPSVSGFRYKLGRSSDRIVTQTTLVAAAKERRIALLLGSIIFYLTATSFVFPFQLNYPYTLHPVTWKRDVREEPIPPVKEEEETTELAKFGPFPLIFSYLHSDVLGILNHMTLRIKFYGLFTTEHLLGIYLYRVILIDRNGSELEPVKVFMPDMTAGPLSGSIGTIRVLQSEIYSISRFAHVLMCDSTYDLKNDWRISAYAKKLIDFSLTKLGGAAVKDINTARILVRPIIVPEQFAGDIKLWEKVDWITFVTYNTKEKSFEWGNNWPKVRWRINTRFPPGSWLTIKPCEELSY